MHDASRFVIYYIPLLCCTMCNLLSPLAAAVSVCNQFLHFLALRLYYVLCSQKGACVALHVVLAYVFCNSYDSLVLH
jgi:hypothetical protein